MEPCSCACSRHRESAVPCMTVDGRKSGRTLPCCIGDWHSVGTSIADWYLNNDSANLGSDSTRSLSHTYIYSSTVACSIIKAYVLYIWPFVLLVAFNPPQRLCLRRSRVLDSQVDLHSLLIIFDRYLLLHRLEPSSSWPPTCPPVRLQLEVNWMFKRCG